MSFLNTLASGSASYGRFRSDTNLISFSSFAVVACIVAVWLILLPDTHTQKAVGRIKSVDCVESNMTHNTNRQSRFECESSIEFKTNDGKSIVGKVRQSSNFKPVVGSEMEISYDPQNPSDISTLTIPLKSIGFIVCCITVLILSCILFERQMVKSNSTYASIYGAGTAVSDFMSIFRR